MNGDINTALNALLSDPEKLSAMMGAVSNVMNSTPETRDPPAEPASAPTSSLPVMPKLSDDRIRLLEALKPFVAEEKKEKVDKLIRMMTLGSLAGTFKNYL